MNNESRSNSVHTPKINIVDKNITASFEFFPPKTDKLEKTLWSSIERLAPLNPSFISVTYGAGGSTRKRTHAIVTRIQHETGIPAAAHLTCVAASKAEVDKVARQYWEAGIRHIVALRGDPPDGGKKFIAHPQGYFHASDLVCGLKKIADFEISIAAYPEVHPEAKSPEADIENLKRKIDCGASRAITQFFFNPESYFRFRDKTTKFGLNIPIVPGILPVTNFSQVQRFSAVCGASVPSWMVELFNGLDDDPATHQMIAASVAIDQCRSLMVEGVKDFHFYTLNRADLTYVICKVLSATPPTL